MAIYHCAVKIIGRSSGRSAVGAAAYRAGEKLENERDGRTHDYTRKDGVVHTEIMTPDNAPEWAKDREKLWNEVEKAEKSIDAQLCREVEVALPTELTPDQQKKLIRDYVKENFVDHGMIADVAIHDKGDGNPHAHILLTMREVDREGNWQQKCKKEYELDKDGNKQRLPSGNYKCRKVETNDWNKKESLEKWREGWEKTANHHLEKAGHEARIDRRSLKDQGIDREPQIHEGRAAQIQKKEAQRGKSVELDRSKLNREIKERNAEYKKLVEKERRYEKNVARIIAKSKTKEKVVVRTEQGAEKVQASIEQKKLNLATVDKICVREIQKIDEGIKAREDEIKRLKEKQLPPENVKKAALNKLLGKDITQARDQLDKDKARLMEQVKTYNETNAGWKAREASTKLLDIRGQMKLQESLNELKKQQKELAVKGDSIERREAELSKAIDQKLKSPEARKKLEHIEKRINQVGREADKKITIIENEIKDQRQHRDKFESMHNQIKDRVKDLGNVEITITGPMTRDNFQRQGQSQVSKLLQNRPAPAKPRGHTQARIADDDDLPKRKGRGLGD